MRFVFAFLFLVTPVLAFPSAIWNYDVAGKVTGPATAADYLSDIAVGDDFFIKMKVSFDDTGHKVSFAGNIGQWFFLPQETEGFYAAGDNAPERFFTPGSDSVLDPPNGSLGEIQAVDLFLTFLGFDQLGNAPIPEEQRLVKSDGRLDPAWFHSGELSFNFLAILDPETGESDETDLNGSILTVTQVPEPSMLVLVGLGGLSLGVAAFRRRQRPAR